MSKLNSLTCLVSAGYPVWYSYGVSRGVIDVSSGLRQELRQNAISGNYPEWEKYEAIIGNKFDLTGVKLMKLLKYGKISFLRNPKAIFRSGRSIRFQFDMFHGNGVLDKAIDVLEEKERDDFRKFVNEKNSYNQGNMFICKSQNIMDESYSPQNLLVIFIKYK